MKLRTANKIWNAIGTEREAVYSVAQQNVAISHVLRSRDSKDAHEFWHALMRCIGIEGRAKLVARYDPAAGLRLLMETPEEKWPGSDQGCPRVIDVVN